MGRFSPLVLPRNRGADLADALLGLGQEATTLRQQRDQRKDDTRYREASLDLRRQELDQSQRYRQQLLDRQRAGDAANGIMYDPDQSYGGHPEARLNLSPMPGAPLPIPDVVIPAGRRAGLRDLGGGYTLDPTRTPEARTTAAASAEAETLANALEQAGVAPGVAGAAARLPQALPYLLPRETATPSYDPSSDVQTQRERYFRQHGLGRYDPAERASRQPAPPSPASRLNYAQDVARTYAGGVDAGENPDAMTVAQQGYATYLRDLPKEERSQTQDPAIWRTFEAEGQRIANGGGSLFFNLNGLGDLDRLRGGTTGTSTPARPTPARPAPATAVPGPVRYQRTPRADRWQELVNGGMQPDEATAQVRREFGTR